MKNPTDYIPIRFNCLSDKVDLGTPGTSNVFKSVKLAMTDFAFNKVQKGLSLILKNHNSHNDTNRLPTGSEICLENIPSPW